jgi:hypothetical protein
MRIEKVYFWRNRANHKVTLTWRIKGTDEVTGLPVKFKIPAVLRDGVTAK